MKGMFIGLSALVVAMGLAFGVLLSNAYSTIDGLRNDSARSAATTSQLRAAEARISSLTTEVSTISGQVGTVTGQLKSTCPFGDLISCTDLSQFQQSFTMNVSGTDSYGGNLSPSAYPAGNPWLPRHCFKQ